MSAETRDNSNTENVLKGGCSCSRIRYMLQGMPSMSGLCYCNDCQKATSSSCIPFMSYSAAQFKLGMNSNSELPASLKQSIGIAHRGTEKVMNFCGDCGTVIFGGWYGKETEHTIYAGTLDPEFREAFVPTMALFVSRRPPWAKLALSLQEFETMP